MVVKTYRDALARTGLEVGEANARRFFNRRTSSIELHLDDLHIQCTLSPDFWQGHPAIHDPRLSEWLEFKVARRGNGRSTPILLTMSPLGDGAYVLRPAPENRYDAFGADVAQARRSPSHPILPHTDTPPLHVRSVA